MHTKVDLATQLQDPLCTEEECRRRLRDEEHTTTRTKERKKTEEAN